MKTICLQSSIRDNFIYEQLKKQDFKPLSDIKWIPFSAYLNEAIPSYLPLSSQSILLYKQLQTMKHEFPIYGKMFCYFSFVEQITKAAYDFACCIMFKSILNLEDFHLPSSTQSEQEIARLVNLCLTNKEFYPNIHEIQLDALDKNIELTPSFHTSIFEYAVFEKFKETCFTYSFSAQSINHKSYRFALNPRIEIESIAQEIINDQLAASDVMLVVLDSTYNECIKQVFTRYQIPFGITNYSTLSTCFEWFISCLQIAKDKDTQSLLHALKINAFDFTVSTSLIHALNQFTNSIEDIFNFNSRFNDFSSPLLSKKESELYLKTQCEINALVDHLQPILTPILTTTSLSELCSFCFDLCNQTTNNFSKQEILQCKSYLEEVIPLCDDFNDIEIIIEQLKNKQIQKYMSTLNVCAITDLTHPLPSRKRAYIVGASQKNAPGFKAKSGLFDEKYLSKTSYPSLQSRFDSHMKQIKWLDTCAEDIYYSFALLDYQGKKAEASLELETSIHQPTELKCIINEPEVSESHFLTPELAQQLFFKDDRITGSVSSFEMYFRCPYSYFLKYGLCLPDFEYTSITANTMGTISHAILENACKQYGKNYASISKDEMIEIANPYKQDLMLYYPKEVEIIQLVFDKLIDNLMTSFEFLIDLEKHTSFEPKHLEVAINSDYFSDITLRGVIDRIDFSYDCLRIIDYKSSSKSLSENQVKAGLQLQLCTYLILAQHLFKKEAVGAYYYSLKNESISLTATRQQKDECIDWTDEDISQEVLKSHRLSGWTTKEVDGLDYTGNHIKNIRVTKNGLSYTLYDFDQIEECIKELYKLLVSKIRIGNIDLSPVDGACTYCKYRPICRFKGQQKEAKPIIDCASLKKGGSTDEME